MSHFFISYSHENLTELEILLAYMKKGAFSDSEIWYDGNIEAGERWSDEIEVALEEAYAIIVIVTQHSMRSLYVNYEWSWGIGYGKPVIPLLFEDVPKQEQHPILSMQYRDCTKQIPESLIDLLKSYRAAPSLLKKMNRDISDHVMQFRVLVKATLWLYHHTILGVSGVPEYSELMQETINEGRSLFNNKLPEIWYSRSFAFSKTQKRQLEVLVANCVEFVSRLETLQFHTQFLYANKDYSSMLHSINQFHEQEWEPVASAFVKRSDYESFDLYLSRISTGQAGFSNSEKFQYYPLIDIAISYLAEHQQTLLKDAIEKIKARLSQ